MAARKTTKTNAEPVSKAVDEPSRFRMGEIGNSGVPIFNGVSNEELKKELNHPNSVKTYKLMSYHPAVNSALSFYDTIISKSRYRFVPPVDATEQEKERTKIVESMFYDMEHSIQDFVSEAMTMLTFGWAPVEKVFRKRTYASGSDYNDGLIGIRKLPLRSQESITKFVFDETGNDVIGIEQNMSGLSDPYNRYLRREKSDVIIPKSKFMLFSLGKNRQNPYGTSHLRNVYTAWKYLQAIEELEAQSIVKDINGLPVLYIASEYMSANASDEQKARYAEFQNFMRNLQQGSQSSAILPSFYDPDTRQPLFKLELLSQDGKKNFDLNKVKEYYRTMIFIGMGADVLLLGNAAMGSFAIGSLKSTMAGSTAEMFMDRIMQVINDDLIRQLYVLNGWDTSRRCKMDYEDISEIDLESLSKGFQRLGATGYLPRTLDVVNRGLESLGIDVLPDSTTQEELDAMLPDKTTRSGDSLNTPSGGMNGTANDVASGDNSSMNLDNTA